MTILFPSWSAVRSTCHRLESMRVPSTVLSYTQKALNLPHTLCDQTAGFLAQKTIQTLSYASPLLPKAIVDRYHQHYQAQIDHCLDAIEELATEALTKQLTARLFLEQAKKCQHQGNWIIEHMLSLMKLCLDRIRSFCPEFVTRLMPRQEEIDKSARKQIQTLTFSAQQRAQATVLSLISSQKAQLRKQLSEETLLPLIDSLQKKSIEYISTQTVKWTYSFTIKYFSLPYLAQTIGSLLPLYEQSSYAVWTAEKGLQTYIWGPTIYQCGSIAHKAYKKKRFVEQIEQQLEGWKGSIQETTTQLGLPDCSRDLVLKSLAILFSELPFFSLDLLKAQEQDIKEKIRQLLESSLLQTRKLLS